MLTASVEAVSREFEGTRAFSTLSSSTTVCPGRTDHVDVLGNETPAPQVLYSSVIPRSETTRVGEKRFGRYYWKR